MLEQLRVFGQLEKIGHGMQFVGWYHSHPRIKPFPSMKDLQMQIGECSPHNPDSPRVE